MTPAKGVQHMQLDYFKLYTYCVDRNILKRTRRMTPSEAARRSPDEPGAELEAAEGALIRLFADMLKSLFGQSPAKTRNVLEFTVPLPDGDWWSRREEDGRLMGRAIARIADSGTADSAVYDRYVRFRPPSSNARLPTRVEVAPDGQPGSSRWGRRRFETLKSKHRSAGRFHEAAKAVAAWKARMDAILAEANADDDGKQNAD
jgi:hypothetical protein